MSDKLYSITLQQSLEWNGVSFEPGEEIEVPEWLYDRLVEDYTNDKTEVLNSIDPALLLMSDII